MSDSMHERLAVVMAAGKGTRMKSDLPKVLVPARGRPMIEFVLDALAEAGIEKVLVVVGYRAADVEAQLKHRKGLTFVEQKEQRGTGHAVQMCLPHLAKHDGPVTILTGDSPLVQPRSLAKLLKVYDAEHPACILGTLHKPEPGNLGRIVRDAAGNFAAIVEQRDATPEQLAVTEVNMSTYVFAGADLRFALEKLTPNNRQNEYYLTDCPGILRGAGRDVRALPILQPCEALSVNTPEELAAIEAEMAKMGYGGK